jgi:hypothetical protein
MPKMHQVIFINGPRRSGKDTATNHIVSEWVNVRHKKLASPMKRALREFFNLPNALWKALEMEASGPLKLEPLPELLGMSWVEALIWFSEEVMKPKFGEDVFGRLMVQEMHQPHPAPLTVISDSRFGSELVPVAKAFGAQNCHVFQLFREGHTFAGDTGSYLDATDLPAGVTFWGIENQYEPSMFRRQILIRDNKILGMERTYD